MKMTTYRTYLNFSFAKRSNISYLSIVLQQSHSLEQYLFSCIYLKHMLLFFSLTLLDNAYTSKEERENVYEYYYLITYSVGMHR